MSGIIVKGNIPKSLKPGVDKFWGEYSMIPGQWESIFDRFSNDEAYVEDVLVPGFGLAPAKDETSGVSYTSNEQQYITRYNHISYALGYQVSREMMDDGKFFDIVMRNNRHLGEALLRTKETVGANILNRAFNSTYTFGDGSELIVSTHATQAGNQSNVLSVAAPLSEASLEDMLIQISDAKDHKGNFIALKGQKLIIPTALQFEAERILKTNLRPETANNDLNAMKNMGLLPEGIAVNQYLTSDTAFFIKTNAVDGLKFFERTAPEFSRDEDFDAEVMKFKIYSRCSFGATDWRGVYGTPGV